jgi:uncharacterized protein (DUF1786 family)
MSAADVLKSAMARIRNPNRFTANGIALDRHGNEVSYDSEKAFRFSVVGAILRTNANPDDFSTDAMLIRREVGPMGVFEYEERYGHKTVLKMLNRAISVAEAA